MTNEELTAIYNGANGLDPKRHNPITTERIFTAMRSAIAIEREACAKLCDEGAELCDTEWANKRPDEAAELDAVALTKIICASKIRERSNVRSEPPDAALSRQVGSTDGLCITVENDEA